MERYHRSFFGLMEMCNDGEWTKADESQKAIDELEENIILLEEDNSRLRELNDQLSKTISLNSIKFQTDLVVEKHKAWAENIVLLIIALYGFLH